MNCISPLTCKHLDYNCISIGTSLIETNDNEDHVMGVVIVLINGLLK